MTACELNTKVGARKVLFFPKAHSLSPKNIRQNWVEFESHVLTHDSWVMSKFFFWFMTHESLIFDSMTHESKYFWLMSQNLSHEKIHDSHDSWVIESKILSHWVIESKLSHAFLVKNCNMRSVVMHNLVQLRFQDNFTCFSNGERQKILPSLCNRCYWFYV